MEIDDAIVRLKDDLSKRGIENLSELGVTYFKLGYYFGKADAYFEFEEYLDKVKK